MDLLKLENLFVLSLVVLACMIFFDSKLRKFLMKNMFDTSLLGLSLLVILFVFFNSKKDNFQSCCNPAGSTALIRPECVGANLEDTGGCGDGGGAVIRDGTERCMQEERSFSCT